MFYHMHSTRMFWFLSHSVPLQFTTRIIAFKSHQCVWCRGTFSLSNPIPPQCVAPFMVSTSMTKHRPVNFFVRSAPGLAREALNTVGHCSYTSGCLSHALQVSWWQSDSYHAVSCCSSLTPLLLFPVVLQNTALTILLPDWFRMSTFLVRKFRNFATASQRDMNVCKTKETLGPKEE